MCSDKVQYICESGAKLAITNCTISTQSVSQSVYFHIYDISRKSFRMGVAQVFFIVYPQKYSVSQCAADGCVLVCEQIMCVFGPHAAGEGSERR